MVPVRADDYDGIPGLSGGGRGGGGAGIGMNGEVDVNFVCVRAGGADGIGAHGIALSLGQGAPKLVPTVVDEVREGGYSAISHGEDYLDALVMAAGGKIGNIITSESDAQKCWADLRGVYNGCRKAPIGRGGADADVCGRGN